MQEFCDFGGIDVREEMGVFPFFGAAPVVAEWMCF